MSRGNQVLGGEQAVLMFLEWVLQSFFHGVTLLLGPQNKSLKGSLNCFITDL